MKKAFCFSLCVYNISNPQASVKMKSENRDVAQNTQVPIVQYAQWAHGLFPKEHSGRARSRRRSVIAFCCLSAGQLALGFATSVTLTETSLPLRSTFSSTTSPGALSAR